LSDLDVGRGTRSVPRHSRGVR